MPLNNLVVPEDTGPIGKIVTDPSQIYGTSKFWGTRMSVASQLYVDEWKCVLQGYCDKHLIYLIAFGFPLDFNRLCPLKYDNQITLLVLIFQLTMKHICKNNLFI